VTGLLSPYEARKRRSDEEKPRRTQPEPEPEFDDELPFPIPRNATTVRRRSNFPS
jgi:hypothetical protein